MGMMLRLLTAPQTPKAHTLTPKPCIYKACLLSVHDLVQQQAEQHVPLHIQPLGGMHLCQYLQAPRPHCSSLSVCMHQNTGNPANTCAHRWPELPCLCVCACTVTQAPLHAHTGGLSFHACVCACATAKAPLHAHKGDRTCFHMSACTRKDTGRLTQRLQSSCGALSHAVNSPCPLTPHVAPHRSYPHL